jgi:hypothetical protein
LDGATHLSGLQVHRVQPSVVVLDLNWPGMAVVVVLVRDVHDGGHHVRVGLRKQQLEIRHHTNTRLHGCEEFTRCATGCFGHDHNRCN